MGNRTYRKLSQQQLLDEARERFGDDPLAFAFECPNCGDVATVGEFVELGYGEYAGQECIGRHLGALTRPPTERGTNGTGRGCDWVAYGLIRGPWVIVVPPSDERPEHEVGSFPLAPRPVPKVGQRYSWRDGLTFTVTRVARTGEWADIRVSPPAGAGWSKRQPLPLPPGSTLIEELANG